MKFILTGMWYALGYVTMGFALYVIYAKGGVSLLVMAVFLAFNAMVIGATWQDVKVYIFIAHLRREIRKIVGPHVPITIDVERKDNEE